MIASARAGVRVRKYFPGYGDFNGVVTRQVAKFTYLVVYADGDEEDMTVADIKKHRVDAAAAGAPKAAKQAGVAVRKSSRHATSDYGAADAAGEQAGDAVGIPTEAEFAAAGEASAACFATNYWYLGKRRAWFSRGGPNGRTSRMAQVAPRDLLILYEVLQVLRIGGIFCCRAPLDSFFFFFF